MEIRRKALPPDDWLQAGSASLLGYILATQERFDEAEPLLLAGNHGMKGKATAPVARQREAIERLIYLYDFWKKPDNAELWRKELSALEPATMPTTIPATAP